MRTLVLAAFFVAATSFAEPASPTTARLETGRVFLDRTGEPGSVPVEVGCVPISAVVDHRLHVACSDGRVRSFELTTPPTLITELQLDGEVRSLFLLGQQAWVEVARYEATPLRQAALAVRSPGTPSPAPGSGNNEPPLVSAPTTSVPSQPQTTAPAAKAINGDDTVIGPLRQGGVFVFAAALRAMVPIGTLGIGAVVDTSITWHAEIPFALRARLFPIAGVTASSRSGGGVAAGSVDAIFDSRYFAAGLGIGFGTFSQVTGYTQAGSITTTEGAGFMVTQYMRIGTRDGLNFTGQTQLVATPTTGFTFYGGEGLVQIPVRRNWQLVFKGGGSIGTFVFGDVGMRLGIGSEEKPRLFLTPMVGLAYIRAYAGPSVGLAIDYQL